MDDNGDILVYAKLHATQFSVSVSQSLFITVCMKALFIE